MPHPPQPSRTRGSVRLAIWLLLGVVNLAVVGLLALSLSESRDRAQREAERLTRNVLTGLASDLRGDVRQIELALAAIASEVEHQLADDGRIHTDRLQMLVDAVQAHTPQVEAFRIAEASGRVFFGRGVDPAKPKSWADRDNFRDHQAHPDGRVRFALPRVGKVSGQLALGFSLRINGPHGEFAGVVAAPVLLNHFADHLSRYNLGPQGALILRDAQFGLIARVPALPDRPAGQVGNAQVSQELRALIASGQREALYQTPRGADGQSRLAAYKMLDSAPLIVVAAMHQDDVLAGWQIELQRKALFAALFLALSGWLGAWLLRLLAQVEADRTQLRSLNAELRAQTDAAQAASQRKSAFLATMSHEIRTPMNAVIGLLHLLRASPLEARQRDYVSKANEATHALLALINDILDFSKIEAGHMRLEHAPFDLCQVLQGVSVVLGAAVAERPIEVLYALSPTLPRALVGDALRLRQVLLNLGGNAIKFTPSGQVVVRLDGQACAGGYALNVQVCDSGIGIAADQLQRIFVGFEQAEASTTRRFGGSGLGLAISQRIVQLMGGQIEVRSTPCQGSCFSFSVTLALADPAAFAPIARPAAHTQLVVVDDHPVARELLAGLAPALGLVPARVIDPQPLSAAQVQVLEQAQRANDADHQLWLIDAQLPNAQAWALVRTLRSLQPSHGALRIVLTAANTRDTLGQLSATDQALIDGWLLKPFSPSMLCALLAQAEADPPSPSTAPGATPAQMPAATAAASETSAEMSAQSAAPPASAAHPAGAQAPIPTGTPAGTPSAAAPVDSPARAHDAAPSAAPAGLPLQGMRILLVEDNPVNQMVARELLGARGAQVSVAPDGALAVEAVASSLQPFQAVLMDVQMPVMDGLEATRRIRALLGEGVHLPIIGLTANAMASDRDTCLAAGMDAHVGKPFDPDALTALLLKLTR